MGAAERGHLHPYRVPGSQPEPHQLDHAAGPGARWSYFHHSARPDRQLAGSATPRADGQAQEW